MLLYLNPPSPYARKVVVVAHEVGLAEKIEILKFDPWTDPEGLIEVTPLCKVPVLRAKTGEIFVESSTICEFLMEAAGQPLPAAASERFEILRRAALAHGMMDAAFVSVIEKRRPQEKQWQDWVVRQRRALVRTLPTLELPPPERFDLGDITLACTLAYLDFRLDDLPWRNKRPDLSHWLDDVSQRSSMIATAPRDQSRPRPARAAL
jgi:glutathione S-transferase